LPTGANQQTQEMRYLLGTLTDEERQRFEEVFFQDNEAFAEVEIAEDELVDAYVRKHLSAADQKRFERILAASPRLMARVQFAKVLKQSTAASTPPERAKEAVERPDRFKTFFGPLFTPQPAYQFALGICVLIAVGAAIILGISWARLRSQSRQLAAEKAALERQKQDLTQELANQRSQTDRLNAEMQNTNLYNEKLNQELENARDQLSSHSPQILPALLLLSGATRSNGTPSELTLNPHAKAIQLKLALDSDDYPSYQVIIKSTDRQVLSQPGLRPSGPKSGRIVSLKVPSNSLAPGDYLVTLSGRGASGNYEFVTDYRFRVKK